MSSLQSQSVQCREHDSIWLEIQNLTKLKNDENTKFKVPNVPQSVMLTILPKFLNIKCLKLSHNKKQEDIILILVRYSVWHRV